MIKVKLVDCKESVQQWSAMGLDVKVGDVLDRILGLSSSVKQPMPEERQNCGNIVEYNGYDYQTVLIGDQCWFAENLRTEKYRNGDVILANLNDSEWTSNARERPQFTTGTVYLAMAVSTIGRQWKTHAAFVQTVGTFLRTVSGQ